MQVEQEDKENNNKCIFYAKTKFMILKNFYKKTLLNKCINKSFNYGLTPYMKDIIKILNSSDPNRNRKIVVTKNESCGSSTNINIPCIYDYYILTKK